jgi:hypothetical protein
VTLPLQPPSAGPISNASAVYLGVNAEEFADGGCSSTHISCSHRRVIVFVVSPLCIRL